MTSLIHYKATFHAGEYIDLNYACTETQQDQILPFLSGYFPIKKQIISGIKIESNEFVYRYNYAYAFCGYDNDIPQYTRLFGYHLISNHKHKTAEQENKRQTAISNYLSLHEPEENASYFPDLKQPHKPTYSYHYYVSSDPDQAMKFDSFIERDQGVLTSACGLLKRKGRVDIYRSESNSNPVQPMDDPVKVTFLSDSGTAGQLACENENLSDLENYFNSENIQIVSTINLFD